MGTVRFELDWKRTKNLSRYEIEVFGPDKQLEDFLTALVHDFCHDLNTGKALAIKVDIDLLRPPLEEGEDDDEDD